MGLNVNECKDMIERARVEIKCITGVPPEMRERAGKLLSGLALEGLTEQQLVKIIARIIEKLEREARQERLREFHQAQTETDAEPPTMEL